MVKNIKKFFSLLSIMDYILSLNNSKFVAGITMLVVNLGSKYLAEELSDSQEALFTNVVIRRFVIFTVVLWLLKIYLFH